MGGECPKSESAELLLSPLFFIYNTEGNSSNRRNVEKRQTVTTSQVLGCKDVCLDCRRFGFIIFTDTLYTWYTIHLAHSYWGRTILLTVPFLSGLGKILHPVWIINSALMLINLAWPSLSSKSVYFLERVWFQSISQQFLMKNKSYYLPPLKNSRQVYQKITNVVKYSMVADEVQIFEKSSSSKYQDT